MNIQTSYPSRGACPTLASGKQVESKASLEGKREVKHHSTTGGLTFEEYSRGGVPFPEGFLARAEPEFKVGWKDLARAATGMAAGAAIGLQGGPLVASVLGGATGLGLARVASKSGAPAGRAALVGGGMGLFVGIASLDRFLAVNLGLGVGLMVGLGLPYLLAPSLTKVPPKPRLTPGRADFQLD